MEDQVDDIKFMLVDCYDTEQELLSEYRKQSRYFKHIHFIVIVLFSIYVIKFIINLIFCYLVFSGMINIFDNINI